MAKVLFGLPLRQVGLWERHRSVRPRRGGMESSILAMAGLDWPLADFSMLSRRLNETRPWP